MTRIFLDGPSAGDTVNLSVTQKGFTRSIRIASYAIPPLAQGLPIITGTRRTGQTVACTTPGLTGVTGYRWLLMGQPIPGETASTLLVPAVTMEAHCITCEVTCDQGVLRAPTICVRMDMAGMSMMGDLIDALVRHAEATHISAADGPWSSPSTWQNGLVPTRNGRVLIQRKHSVTYDVDAANAPRLDWIRTDGVLTWAIDRSTRLHVETSIVTQMGKWIIGTAAARVPNDVKVEILIADRLYEQDDVQPTDLSIADDPDLLGRGIIWEGMVSAWGIHRTRRAKPVVGTALIAGSTAATMDRDLVGWRVGDEIVVAGTYASGIMFQSETEERVITAITGRTITWNAPLVHDHTHQRPDIERDDLQVDIANLSSNVVIRSECGARAPIWRRGHLMGMHHMSRTDLWDVRMTSLGRTEKGRLQTQAAGILDAGNLVTINVDRPTRRDIVPATARSNRQTRYALHLHFVGNREDDKGFVDTVDSCVVDETPGWSLVHHGCHANMTRNLVYDFGGAGMVAEAGNETGLWTDNCAIRSRNRTTETMKNSEGRGEEGDFFTMGSGFAMRGRALIVNDNTAFDVMSGYHFYHRGSGTGTINAQVSPRRVNLDISDLQGVHDESISVSDYPIIHWADNEAGGCRYGFSVTKSNPNQGHGLNVDLKRFKCWGYSGAGLYIEYVAQYRVSDADLVAGKDQPTGVNIGNNAYDISIVRCRTTGNAEGIYFQGGDIFASNADYDEVNHPRYAVIAHEYVRDTVNRAATAVTRETVLEPATRAPDVDLLPFVIFDWNGSTQINTSVSNAVTGILRDSLSLGGKLPKPVDNLGLYVATGASSNAGSAGFLSQKTAARDGYWQHDGENVLIIPLYFGDRITARPIKVYRAVRCTGSMTGYVDNGPFTLSASAPVVAPAIMTLPVDGTATLDVLALATVEAGATARLEKSHYAPDHGEIVLADGRVTYTPNAGFRGVDSCYVWVGDGRGRATTVQVSIRVGLTAAQPIAAALWDVTAKTATTLTLRLRGKPDAGGRRIEQTEYAFDGAATWTRLCYGWVPSPHAIALNGATPATIALRYRDTLGGYQSATARSTTPA